MSKATFLQKPLKLSPDERIQVTVNDVILELFVCPDPIEENLYRLRAEFINPADTDDVLGEMEVTTLLSNEQAA